MKKLLAIIMTLALLTFAFVGAVAEEETVTWADVEAAAAEVDPDAKFVQVADYNLAMWLPSIFAEQELSEEDAANGIISCLAPEDGSAAIVIMKDEGAEADLETWKQGFIEAGYADADIEVINGIQALTYTDAENDTLNILYKIEESNEILQFTFGPMSDEGFASLATIIGLSLQEME